MEVKKLYPRDDAKVTLVCEQCGKTRDINVADVKVVGKPQKVRCGCKHEFFISIEMRKFYRKPTKLPGEYVTIGANTSVRPDRGHMIVEDVSRGGLGFRTERPPNLRAQDMIQVKFHLDDRKRSEVSKRAVVKRVNGYAVGAEFLDLDVHNDANRALVAYLM